MSHLYTTTINLANQKTEIIDTSFRSPHNNQRKTHCYLLQEVLTHLLIVPTTISSVNILPI
jgi:hypothetical protein